MLPKIDVVAQSCCNTLCIMDMCPYEDERHAAKMERRHSQSYKECDFLRK
jgi:hypothetical protein